MALFRDKPGGRPSIRDLVRQAQEAGDPFQSGAIYTQAAELAAELGKKRRATSLLRDAIASLQQARTDSRTLAGAHARIAQVAERLGLVQDAMSSYARAFTMDPSLVSAAQSARAIAMAAAAWPHVVQLLDQEISVVGTRHERAKLLCEQAVLVRDRLSDLDGAVETLRRAIKTDVVCIEAHRELAESLIRRAEGRTDEDWAARDRNDAADALCDLSDIVADDERLAYLDRALDVAPEHLGALEKLEDVAPTDKERLVFRWTRHLESFPDSPIADELRLRLGRAHVEAGKSDVALPYLEQLARQNDIECALLVVEIHANAGRTDEARAWATALVDRVPKDQRLPILRRVFQAFRDTDIDAAFDVAPSIVDEDPSDAVATDFCETHLAQHARWDELERFLARLARRFDDGSKRRLSLLRRLAAVQENERKDPKKALETWRAIEDETDDDSVRIARGERARLAEIVGEWDELAELLDGMALRTRGPKRVALLLRVAAVHRDHRRDPESAARAFLRVLDVNAPIDEAMVLSSLSDALDAAGKDNPVVPDVHGTAERAELARRASIYRMLGQLYDRWSEHEKAWEAWSALRALEPADPEALERLVELAVATERYEQALELLAVQAADAGGARAVALHRRIATVATDRLSAPDRAADALTTALELAPDDRTVAEDLAVALARAGRNGEQTVVLRRLASSAPDAASRREAQIRLANVLADALRDDEEALAVWKQIAEETSDEGVLGALIDEARADAEHARVDLLLRRLHAVAPTAERRAEIALERAENLAQKLDRVRDAIAFLVEATARDARTHLPALSYLETLSAQVGDDFVLASALEGQVPLVPEGMQKLLLTRLADLYEKSLDNPVSAVRTLERWEQVRPDDPEPRLRLVPHLVAMRSWDALLARLERLIEIARTRQAEWVDTVVRALDVSDPSHDQPLADFFVELAKHAASPEQRRDLLLRAAAVYELSGVLASAFDAASGALAITGPEDRLLTIVDRLASRAGRSRELDAIYDRFTGKGAPAEMRKALVLRHAEILREAGRYPDALDRLLRVSALAPTDPALLDALERFGPLANRLPEVLSAYEDRLALTEPGDPSVGLVLRAVRASYANERGYDALRFFARAIELADGDLRLLDRIEKVATELGRPALEQVMTAYEAAARKEALADRRALFLVRGARVMLEIEPGAIPAAFRLLDEALAAAPAEEWLLDAIEAIAIEAGFMERLDEHLEKLIEETMSNEVAATLLRRRARILYRHLGKPSESADAYLRLWAIRPNDPDVFRHLRVCLLETGRIHELISAAERELSHLEDPAQRLALMREIARLWEEDAHNPWEASDAWKRVLAADPDDAPAKEALARLSIRAK